MIYKKLKLIENVTVYHGSPNTNISKLEIGKEKTNGNEFGTRNIFNLGL